MDILRDGISSVMDRHKRPPDHLKLNKSDHSQGDTVPNVWLWMVVCLFDDKEDRNKNIKLEI